MDAVGHDQSDVPAGSGCAVPALVSHAASTGSSPNNARSPRRRARHQPPHRARADRRGHPQHRGPQADRHGLRRPVDRERHPVLGRRVGRPRQRTGSMWRCPSTAAPPGSTPTSPSGTERVAGSDLSPPFRWTPAEGCGSLGRDLSHVYVTHSLARPNTSYRDRTTIPPTGTSIADPTNQWTVRLAALTATTAAVRQWRRPSVLGQLPDAADLPPDRRRS